jgi:hypothetical protein
MACCNFWVMMRDWVSLRLCLISKAICLPEIACARQ